MSVSDDMVRTRRDISTTMRSLEIAEDELAQLRRELTGLQGAETDVRGDKQTFYRQLGEKRVLASRAGLVSTARCGRDYAAAMSEVLGSAFEHGVVSGFDGFIGQIRKAISDVENEIRQKEGQINTLRGKLRQLYGQLQAQEHAAAEERAREGG